MLAALLLVGASRKLTRPLLCDAILATVVATAMTLLILVAAFYLNFIFGVLGVPTTVSSYVVGQDIQPMVIMLILVCLYLLLGCFLDSLAMMIATLPIVWPIVQMLGYEAIWFGTFLFVMCKLALITPPVGMNRYIMQSVRGRGSVGIVIAGVVPFLGCILVLVGLISVFPGLVISP